ncbi:MAG TPA: NAD(+) diphosphatase [Jatrophihabitans sp.]|nr:NAD(+) diphosphatase [Jatrophihabitans sp.]
MTPSRPEADPWAIPEVPLLSRTGHDRRADVRDDPEYLQHAWHDPATRVLLLSADGAAQIAAGPDLVLRSPAEAAVPGIRVYLGAVGDTDFFAVLADAALPGQESWATLRDVGARLTDRDVGLLTTAVALQAWHHRHPHCPRCGALTRPARAGWIRSCPVDGSEHFPRTDPAVIMLVHDGQGRCVLARGPQWAPGRMSVLAGFVKAGESAEAAVAREVGEEVGIKVRDIRYAGSQPHPFPASLMLGFTARLDGDPTLRIDGTEIVEAGWFTREQVRATGEWGDEAAGPDAPPLRGLPPSMSIARQLINTWLAAAD